MDGWYDDDMCRRCHDRKHQEHAKDHFYEDIKSFVNKVQILEDKLDFVSEIFPKAEPPRIRNAERFSPKEEANVLIDKVRLLENKINKFARVLHPENSKNNDVNDQTDADKAFRKLVDKLKTLEEKLGAFSKIKLHMVNSGKSGDSKPVAVQVREKLKTMEDKIEQFYKLIPSNHAMREEEREKNKVEDPSDLMEQMQQLAEKMQLVSKLASSPKSMIATKLPIKRPKSFLPKPIFSGKLTPRRKPTVKKGFITWPSEEDLSQISNDRQCYIMRCGKSQADVRPKNLISEPSEFNFLDRSLNQSQTNGLSCKESQAFGISRIKNSGLA